MKIGRIVKEYRQSHGMTMQEFADSIGKTKGYISMLERGKNPQTGKPIAPALETLQAIANAIDIDFNTLVSQLDEDQDIAFNTDYMQSNANQMEKQYTKINRLIKDFTEQFLTLPKSDQELVSDLVQQQTSKININGKKIELSKDILSELNNRQATIDKQQEEIKSLKEEIRIREIAKEILSIDENDDLAIEKFIKKYSKEDFEKAQEYLKNDK